MKKLSRMQQRVYDYIAESIRQNGYPPSVREIGEALDLRSPSTVHFHIKHLEELGYLEKGAGKGRAITLKGTAATAPVQAAPAVEEAPVNRIPVVGNVAAGSPILAQECEQFGVEVCVDTCHVEVFVQLPPHSHTAFAEHACPGFALREVAAEGSDSVAT